MFPENRLLWIKNVSQIVLWTNANFGEKLQVWLAGLGERPADWSEPDTPDVGDTHKQNTLASRRQENVKKTEV